MDSPAFSLRTRIFFPSSGRFLTLNDILGFTHFFLAKAMSLSCNDTDMTSRAERKALANKRRLDWRTRWSLIARKEMEKSKSIEHAVRIVGEDMNRLAAEHPQLKSEIVRAGNEFLDKLALAVARTASAPQRV